MQLKTRVRAVRHTEMVQNGLPAHDRRRANLGVYTKSEWFKTTYQAAIRIGIAALIAAIGYLYTTVFQSRETSRQVAIQWEQISSIKKEISAIQIEMNAENKTKNEILNELKRQLCDIRNEIKTLRGLHLK